MGRLHKMLKGALLLVTNHRQMAVIARLLRARSARLVASNTAIDKLEFGDGALATTFYLLQ